jgi:hypothetical protein
MRGCHLLRRPRNHRPPRRREGSTEMGGSTFRRHGAKRQCTSATSSSFRETALPRISRDLFVLGLGYRLQESAQGGLQQGDPAEARIWVGSLSRRPAIRWVGALPKPVSKPLRGFQALLGEALKRQTSQPRESGKFASPLWRPREILRQRCTEVITSIFL